MSDICVVTGSSSGIGLEFCRQLLERGESVLGVCRKVSSEMEELKKKTGTKLKILSDVHLDQDLSLKKMTNYFQENPDDKIKLLLNNAGIYIKDGDFFELDFEGISEQFLINSIVPLKVTKLLFPYLLANAILGYTSSLMGSLTDNAKGGSYGYRMSKAALNMGLKSLSVDLKSKLWGDEVCPRIAILHPGYVKTKMTGGKGLIDVHESVTGLMKILDSITDENSGTFWHTNGKVLPW